MRFLILLLVILLTSCTTHYQNALCNKPDYYEKWQEKCDEFSTVKPNAFGEVALIMLVIGANSNYQPYQNSLPVMGPVTPNAYGPGIGMDATGRAVTLQPAFNGGNTSNSYIQKHDAYGPGIHMDQYGQPVQYK